ncbi:DUF4394 domain-containing protein [Plantactinospora sonchi]|uniref:DUF4394 domain-containing protein n=1 Tax=Plantactinospora sonchi TaxID=1544735 RepID=A0ABU7RNU2_9ACTN
MVDEIGHGTTAVRPDGPVEWTTRGKLMKARVRSRVAAAATLVAAAAVTLVGFGGNSSAAPAPGLPAYGITADGRLMLAFNTATPEQNDWVRAVTGLSGDNALVGIDLRPQDGKLYGSETRAASTRSEFRARP